MKIGIQLPEVEWEVPFPEYLAMARAAEDVGFDSIWVGDHLLYDLPAGPRGPWEAWTTLAAIAAITDRVELGPLVASTSFHAPTMLAKQAATVDAASEGRLIVGLGAGWNRREYEAFGFAYDRRVSRFEEAFTIIRSLLRHGRVDFHGRFFDVDDCVLHPRPPRPDGPPLMVGSIGPRMLGITLPHVDAWNVWWSITGTRSRRTEGEGRRPGSSPGRDRKPSRRRQPFSCGSRAVVAARWATTGPASGSSPSPVRRVRSPTARRLAGRCRPPPAGGRSDHRTSIEGDVLAAIPRG